MNDNWIIRNMFQCPEKDFSPYSTALIFRCNNQIIDFISFQSSTSNKDYIIMYPFLNPLSYSNLQHLSLFQYNPLPSNICCPTKLQSRRRFLWATKNQRICFAFTYFVALADPIFFTDPSFTIFPSTASTVVGLTSGKNPQISDLDIGNTLFSTVCSILSVFFSFFPFTVENLASSSL